MKKALFLIAITSTQLSTVGQDWSPIYFKEALHYQDSQGQKQGLYMDSLHVAGDTLTGLFMLKDAGEVECASGYGCYTVCKRLGTYFMQRYAVFYPNGVVEFQNPDTFRIRTTAQLEETWTYGVDENGLGISATVTQIVDTLILGEPDSVKVISVDGAGEIFLSKHHGITGIQLNEDTLTLESIPARNLGGSLLTIAEVFDFEVGDVFFYYDHAQKSGLDDFTLQGHYRNIRRLARYEVTDVDLNGSTISYYFEASIYCVKTSMGPNIFSLPSLSPSGYSTFGFWFELDLSQNEPFLGRPSKALTSVSIENSNPEDYGFWMDTPNFLSSIEYSDWEYWMMDFDMDAHWSLGKIYSDSIDGRRFFSMGFKPIDYDSINSNLTAQEVMELRPADFFSMDSYSICFSNQSSISPDGIANYFVSQTSENSSSPFGNYGVILDPDSYFADTYAMAEGLGITGYHAQLYGLEQGIGYSGALIGYIKNGEEFGFIANPDQLQTLSANSDVEVHSFAPYPNPATDEVRYDVSSPVHALAIYDLSGKLLIQESAADIDGTVDISILGSGIYILKLTMDEDIAVGRIVKL